MPEGNLPNQNLNSSPEPQAPASAPIVKNEKPAGKSPVLKFVLLVIITVLIIAALTGAYYLGMNKSNSNNQTTSTQTISPSPTPDPTGSWNTYINNRFGFTMKHPQSFTIRQELDETRNIEATQETALYQVAIFDDSTKEESTLTLNLGENSNFPTNESYRNFIKTKRGIKEEIKNLDVDGVNSLYYTYIGGAPGLKESLYNSTLEFARNSKTYSFTLSNLESDGKQEDLLKQIASTIKFTDSTSQSSDTSDWKTYTSKAGNFSISYPNSWTVLDDNKNEIPEDGTATIVFGPNITSLTEDKNTRLVIQIQKPDASTGITDAKKYISSISKVKAPSTYIVDGISAYKANYLNTNTAFEIITLDKNNAIYSISFGQNSIPNISKSDQKVYEQILSTFKFN